MADSCLLDRRRVHGNPEVIPETAYKVSFW